MKIKTICSAGWVIYQPVTVEFDIDTILQINARQPDQVLRDHHRSQVNKINFKGADYVVKTPNNKNKSYWIRFTTLYRDSEVLKDLKSQLLLKNLNINTVNPVAALEIRRFGMVIDSRIIYQFKKGAEISIKHYPTMISIMNSLHRNGYLHDDAHTKNFLQDDDQVFAIDCKPRNNLFGQTGIAHNFITLARRSDHPHEIYQLIGSSPSTQTIYKIINGLINFQQIQRAFKNKLRLFLGIEYKRKH